MSFAICTAVFDMLTSSPSRTPATWRSCHEVVLSVWVPLPSSVCLGRLSIVFPGPPPWGEGPFCSATRLPKNGARKSGHSLPDGRETSTACKSFQRRCSQLVLCCEQCGVKDKHFLRIVYVPIPATGGSLWCGHRASTLVLTFSPNCEVTIP